MAVVTRPCGVFPCSRDIRCRNRTSQNVWTLKSTSDFIKTQLCTVAICLTLFNSTRLPREAYRHGAVPYLVVYSFWLLVVGLPVTLLQLAMGQLSQQDPVGVWRAVPILRGVGHLKVMTSFISCVYNMVMAALAAAYMIWIAKGTFPLKDCTKLHITPNGYENKMNATECFNATFLAPFTEHPQYLGIMAILIFILWFFVPILLYRLRKSYKVALNFLAPVIILTAIILSTFLSNSHMLTAMFVSCEHWTPIWYPYLWYSSMVQALLSTLLASGYLISAGGTVYRESDVRWASTSIISTNLLAGWLWILFWESIGGDIQKDKSFISILVLIYQSSVSEKRTKEWPLLAFGIVFVSGIITVLTLLFPVYDRLHRLTGDHWRLFATAASAVGTALAVAVLARGLEVVVVLDELVVPILAVFTTAVEVVGFMFIYGLGYLKVDIEFLTGAKLPCLWTATWITIPFLLFGITGWWLRTILRATWGQMLTLWPLVGVFVGILIIVVVIAAVAVAKEEQFNLLSKIASAFRPSRLWGPEEPMARYIWMSQRFANDTLSSENDAAPETTNYAKIIFDKQNEKKYNEDWIKNTIPYQSTYYVYTKNGLSNDEPSIKNTHSIYNNHNTVRNNKEDEKFRSPNVCIAKGEVGQSIDCNCNRHFTLHVPDLRNNEITTTL